MHADTQDHEGKMMNTDENGGKKAGTAIRWDTVRPDDILSEKRIQRYIEESRSSDTPERIYAHVELMKVDENIARKNDALLERLKAKEALVKRMSGQMRTALKRKNRKLAKLLRYISILEKMLENNNIDYGAIKKKIKDAEISLTSRPMQGTVTEEDTGMAEYIEAVEIELDDEGREIADED